LSEGLLGKYAQNITDLRLPPDERQPSRGEAPASACTGGLNGASLIIIIANPRGRARALMNVKCLSFRGCDGIKIHRFESYG